MDSQIIFALVTAVIFFGALTWLVVHARKQSQKYTKQTSIKPPESQPKNRAA